MENLLDRVDIVLDATGAGTGKKNKKIYKSKGVKAVFQGGEKNEIADVFFHGPANYNKGLGKDYLKLTSCNTTGLIRSVNCLEKKVGIEKVAITIMRRSADPGDTHRGYVDLAKVEPVPNHQAVDLMTIMPHVDATGLLVHFPMTHGHIINVLQLINIAYLMVFSYVSTGGGSLIRFLSCGELPVIKALKKSAKKFNNLEHTL